MQEIASDPEAWAEALTSLAQDRTRYAAMREAALAFRRDKLAGWQKVVTEDFLPVWQSAMQKEKK